MISALCFSVSLPKRLLPTLPSNSNQHLSQAKVLDNTVGDEYGDRCTRFTRRLWMMSTENLGREQQEQEFCKRYGKGLIYPNAKMLYAKNTSRNPAVADQESRDSRPNLAIASWNPALLKEPRERSSRCGGVESQLPAQGQHPSFGLQQ